MPADTWGYLLGGGPAAGTAYCENDEELAPGAVLQMHCHPDKEADLLWLSSDRNDDAKDGLLFIDLLP
jgi:hypothetical protein